MMSRQKPMWQRMKEKFEEEERLEKERVAKEKEDRERKMRKILTELKNGSTYVYREDSFTWIKVSQENSLLPRGEAATNLFSQYIMVNAKIGNSTYNLTLPLFEIYKWFLVGRTELED